MTARGSDILGERIRDERLRRVNDLLARGPYGGRHRSSRGDVYRFDPTIKAAALIALHIVVWVPSFVGRAPIDLDVERYAIASYLALLVAAWVACVVAVPRNGSRPLRS
jgi:hypothetical protein